MDVPPSCTADDYMRVPNFNPLEDAQYDYEDYDKKQQTKHLPSLFRPVFRGTDKFAELKQWYEEDPAHRQIHLLLEPFLSLLTQSGELTNKFIQGLNNTIITRRQMTTFLTVPEELSGKAEDEQTFPGADIPPTKTVTVDVSLSADVQKVSEVMDDLLDQFHQAAVDDDSEDVISEEWDYGEGGESAEDSLPKISMHVDRLARLSSYDYNNYKIIMDKGAQERDAMSRSVPSSAAHRCVAALSRCD